MYNEPKKIWLGYGGEYCGVKQARGIARNHFLQAVAEFCPEVVRDLKTRVLPIYSQWAEQAKTEEQYRSPLPFTRYSEPFCSLRNTRPLLLKLYGNGVNDIT